MREQLSRRVAITGIGLSSAAGATLDKIWKTLLTGKSTAAQSVSRFSTEGMRTRIAAFIDDVDPIQYVGEREAEDMDRATQLAVLVADRAEEDARIPFALKAPYRFGVAFGTAYGGIGTTISQAQRIVSNGSKPHPLTIPKAMHNAASFYIAKRLNALGPNVTCSTACSSGSMALAQAFKLIKLGEADVMLAASSDAPIVPAVFQAWCEMRVMTTVNEHPERAFRPFDVRRDGFVVGEGAVAMVCEELEHAKRRDAHIYGELISVGNSCDGDSLTKPSATHQSHAMKLALATAHLGNEPLGFIIAHGSATVANDRTESIAIRKATGAQFHSIPVSACKPYFGHMMGPSGMMEFACALAASREGRLFPIAGLEEQAPECPVKAVKGSAIGLSDPVFMCNSFGFGGSNVVLVGRAFLNGDSLR